MEVRMIWANLVSSDLKTTAKFYTDLGFRQQKAHTDDELVSFVFGNANFVINFFTEKRLEYAMRSKPVNAKNENEIIFSISADSKEDVDKWYDLVKSAGASIFAEPENFEQGYTFGFADPDGHKFNILYWPGM